MLIFVDYLHVVLDLEVAPHLRLHLHSALDLKFTLAIAHNPNLEVTITLVLAKVIFNLKVTVPSSRPL